MFFLSIGIKKEDLFYFRIILNLYQVIFCSFPFWLFFLIASPDKGYIILFIFFSFLIFIFYLSIRLLLLNLLMSNDYSRFVELFASLIIYNISFVYLPSDIILQNAYWINYIQYLSPTGWLIILTFKPLNTLYLSPFFYIIIIFIPLITTWIFWKTIKTTWC